SLHYIAFSPDSIAEMFAFEFNERCMKKLPRTYEDFYAYWVYRALAEYKDEIFSYMPADKVETADHVPIAVLDEIKDDGFLFDIQAIEVYLGEWGGSPNVSSTSEADKEQAELARLLLGTNRVIVVFVEEETYGYVVPFDQLYHEVFSQKLLDYLVRR
ncbi:MAG: hypothetical protein DRP01_09040, partial [Archaeoglobales archaeon]